MRILLANKFYYRKGGGEAYLFDLMASLQAHGHEVILFSMQHELNIASKYAAYFVDKVDYNQPDYWLANIQKAWRILYSRQAKNKIAALLEQTKPEIAHLQNIYHQISPSILPVLKNYGIPVILTFHDLKLVCPNYKMRTNGEICERCKPRRFYQTVLHRCVKDSFLASAVCAIELYLHRFTEVYERNVDRFITPSRFYQQKMIDCGIPEKKFISIPNFVHVHKYIPEYDCDDYFIYCGRLSEEKGLLTLVEAMRRVKKGRLYVVGDGPLRPELERTIEEYRIQNVHLTGPKWDKDLVSLMTRARFTVIPSEWYENCPISLIQSYACGKPVLGANIGGIPEMIENERTGLLFEPFSVEDLAEKINYLLGHHGVVVQMGKNARAKAEREYNPERHYAELMRVYSEAMGRGCGL
jgi:glycosyltransferase involved in cell wall biosynthesis